MRYGIPYQGSKNKIANWVIENLPNETTLVDLFAGGCAITYAALLSEKYNKIIANDISEGPEMFLKAIEGGYRNEKRWISREEFYALKNKDPYVSLCWSFGNNRENYLYSKKVEPWKKALHYARVFDDFSEFEKMDIFLPDAEKMTIEAHEKELKEKYITWYLKTFCNFDLDIEKIKGSVESEKENLRRYLCEALHNSGLTQSEVNKRLGTQMSGHYFGKSQWSFPTFDEYKKMQEFLPLKEPYAKVYKLLDLQKSLQSLQSLERLQSLESLEKLQSLEMSNKDYQKMHIPKNAIVYADPPYKGTCQIGYKTNFDYERFENWLNQTPHMVIVSEYSAPRGCVEIISKRKRSTMGSGNKGGCQEEKLFVQKRFLNEYRSRMK